MNCKFCKSKNISKINTYKSIYYLCNECLSSERKTKNSAPLQFLGNFLALIGFKRISNFLTIKKDNKNYIGNGIINPYSNFIDKYKLKNDPNKWEFEKCYSHLFILAKNNDLIKKNLVTNLLEISGAPGIQGDQLTKRYPNINYFTTEFEPSTVNLMKKKLNLNCHLFDVNKIKFEQLIPDTKFDIIYIICSSLFSHNLKDLIRFFDKNLNESGSVIFSVGKNTIGTHFRNMFDEFTHNYQISNNQIIRIFRNNNFILKDYFEWGFGNKNDKVGDLTNVFKGQNIFKSSMIIFYLLLNFKQVSRTLNLSKTPVTYVFKKMENI
ncbi:hypothetical protein N8937_03215 [Candidatus Pelagibacter ubique]|nr:hypothetical protein [Candidatus Pelagibacter ubique]